LGGLPVDPLPAARRLLHRLSSDCINFEGLFNFQGAAPGQETPAIGDRSRDRHFEAPVVTDASLCTSGLGRPRARTFPARLVRSDYPGVHPPASGGLLKAKCEKPRRKGSYLPPLVDWAAYRRQIGAASGRPGEHQELWGADRREGY
jgi:hypothetical protein